ncbi:hypothetical protein BD289DRAFT_60274 [Coniella lustricola]|uniref:Uncharacterized protein n=1 Tax=Coniella lustricola TaxID=2025994 RepID=A0A2T3A0N9_9PEZI|nr:hypothetical protein BD289DRAFT_60274 [Coniella lustricola]
MQEYEQARQQMPGIDNWPAEARLLHGLLYLRGLYPLMPSDWRLWGLRDHPLPEELFMPAEQDENALIRAEKNEYHATKAMRGLFEIHALVRAYRQGGQHDLIASLISRHINQFVRWAEKDSGLFKKRDYVSPVFTIVYTNTQAVGSGQAVVNKCREVVEDYRAEWEERATENYPRLITIFVVIQHIVLVFAADTEVGASGEPFAFAELDMSKKAYWLNTSIAIAIAVMVARRALVAHRESFAKLEDVEDDVDL